MTTFVAATVERDNDQSITVQFETALGYAEVSWCREKVTRYAWLPRRPKKGSQLPSPSSPMGLTQAQQHLIEDLIDYASGTRIDFANVPTDFSHGTSFQQRIWQACQRIPYGEVVTYGELARIAGRPGAARAVGTAMSQNRIPIIVPCHRVISAGKKIGGFTNPQGIQLKKKLLDLEANGNCHLKMPG